MNDIQKVILYYYEEKDSNTYYVPITKYVNSKDDKIKVIIDNLRNNYLSGTNLMSYINEKVMIEKCEYTEEAVTLSFASVLDLSPSQVREEVIYTLANSIFDSTDYTKIIFMQNDRIVNIKTK